MTNATLSSAGLSSCLTLAAALLLVRERSHLIKQPQAHRTMQPPIAAKAMMRVEFDSFFWELLGAATEGAVLAFMYKLFEIIFSSPSTMFTRI